jgi:hypothetical protein
VADKVSDLIKDLSSVPNIVGNLGLSIAAAQKAFNLDYLENIERILGLIYAMLGGVKAGAGPGQTTALSTAEQAKVDAMAPAIQDMLKALAPSRYQFTETSLNVKLDLAQTLQVGGSVGLGVGYGALTLNAAFTIGYSYDYRAAAECNTVIHAIPADPSVFQTLLDRAKNLTDSSLALPAKADIDQAIWDQTSAAAQKLTGITPPKNTTPAATPAGGH